MLTLKGDGGLVVKVSASQPRDHGFEPYTTPDHVYSHDIKTGRFEKADSTVINISCKNLFRNRRNIDMLKPILS
jgi:hypothetical protein